MALNGDVLGTTIWAAIDALSSAQQENTVEVWKAVANEIVDHFKTNGVVVVTGVTSGTASSGPGTIT